MSGKPTESQRLANAASRLLYGAAGWLLVGVGIAGIVVQIGYLTSDLSLADPVVTPAILLLSVVSILFGVFVNPRFRRRLNRRHSVTRFGRVRSVDERVLHAAEGRTERCVSCGSRLDEGLLRRYREEVCVAGVPVVTAAEDENHYCVECATTELGSTPGSRGVEAEPDRSRTDAGLATERD